MFLKTLDANVAKELMAAGAQLIDQRFGCWIFAEPVNYELTENQEKKVVRTNILNL